MQRVLVVDDNLSVAQQIQSILHTSSDFVCVGHAKNGAEAIKLNHGENPDIICMDMEMPGMDGLTAVRSLTKLDKTVKVVMVTSFGSIDSWRAEALKAGARDIVTKPFDAETLLTVLRSL